MPAYAPSYWAAAIPPPMRCWISPLLAAQEPGTSMTWAVRGNSLAKVFGGGTADQLPARGALGERLRALVEQKRLTIEMSFAAQRLKKNGNGVLVDGMTPEGPRTIGAFDRIVAATGQRPDFSFAREMQLDLDPVVESTPHTRALDRSQRTFLRNGPAAWLARASRMPNRITSWPASRAMAARRPSCC